jgi:hypothetical protein
VSTYVGRRLIAERIEPWTNDPEIISGTIIAWYDLVGGLERGAYVVKWDPGQAVLGKAIGASILTGRYKEPIALSETAWSSVCTEPLRDGATSQDIATSWDWSDRIAPGFFVAVRLLPM